MTLHFVEGVEPLSQSLSLLLSPAELPPRAVRNPVPLPEPLPPLCGFLSELMYHVTRFSTEFLRHGGSWPCQIIALLFPMVLAA